MLTLLSVSNDNNITDADLAGQVVAMRVADAADDDYAAIAAAPTSGVVTASSPSSGAGVDLSVYNRPAFEIQVAADALGRLYTVQPDGSYEDKHESCFPNLSAELVEVLKHAEPVTSEKIFNFRYSSDRKQLLKFATDAMLWSVKLSGDVRHEASRSHSKEEGLFLSYRKLDNLQLKEADNWLHKMSKMFRKELTQLPKQYNEETRSSFFDFFSSYGTHYVKKVSTGAQLAFSYANVRDEAHSSSEYNAEVRIKALIASCTISSSGQFEAKDKLATETMSFSCRGGKIPLQEYSSDKAKEWLADDENIRAGPIVIERDLAKLSTLLHGKQRIAFNKALEDFVNPRVEKRAQELPTSLPQSFAPLVGSWASVTLSGVVNVTNISADREAFVEVSLGCGEDRPLAYHSIVVGRVDRPHDKYMDDPAPYSTQTGFAIVRTHLRTPISAFFQMDLFRSGQTVYARGDCSVNHDGKYAINYQTSGFATVSDKALLTDITVHSLQAAKVTISDVTLTWSSKNS